MAILIVDVYRGLVDGVYTSALEPLDVRVYDSDDKHDPERAHLYAACHYAVEHGGLKNCMFNGDKPYSGKEFPALARLPETFSLIAEENWLLEKDGGAEQQMDAAFAAGYLAAVSELNQTLCDLLERDKGAAQAAYQTLQRYMDRQYERFFDFCEKLNHRGAGTD